MKTDKLLQLIQQKKVMRSGGALPLPKHQWLNSEVMSQAGPTQAKANAINLANAISPINALARSINNTVYSPKNRPTVDFIDKRVYDPVVKGKKLEETRRHSLEGVKREELNKMINQAKLVGTDPATLITTAIWESNMGKTDPNLVHDLHQGTPTVEGLDDFSARANMAAQALNRQLNIGKRLYPGQPFYKQMQAFQGYGPLYPHTEKRYYKHNNQAFFGIPVTKENPLRTNVIFPYGKTIENFRDSVVIPTLEQYGIKYKEKGGSLHKYEPGGEDNIIGVRGPNDGIKLPVDPATGNPVINLKGVEIVGEKANKFPWAKSNGTFLANFKGTTLDEEADAERKTKLHNEFVKNQQEEDQKKYGVEAWKTGKTIEQLKDEENEKWNNYYKFQNRLWELEEDPSKWNINDWKNYGIKEGDASAEGFSNPLNWPGLALTGLGAWEVGAPILGAVNSGLSVPLSTVATFGNSAAMPWLTGNTVLGAYGASQIPGNLRRGEYGWAALNSLPFTGPLLGAGFRGAKNLYNTVATGESILPIAWKSPAVGLSKEASANMFKTILSSDKLTDAERALVLEYQYSSRPFTGRDWVVNQDKRDALNKIIAKYNMNVGDDAIATRMFNPENESLGAIIQGKNLNFGDRPTSFSIGARGRYGSGATDRIVIPNRYLKQMGNNFMVNEYGPVSEKTIKMLPANEQEIAQNAGIYYFGKQFNDLPRPLGIEQEREIIGTGLNFNQIGKVKNDVGGYDWIVKPANKRDGGWRGHYAEGGSLPKHQLTGSVSAQLINQALGQNQIKRDATATRNYAQEQKVAANTKKVAPRNDATIAPKGSVRSYVQKAADYMSHAGDPKVDANGNVTYAGTPFDPLMKYVGAPILQSGINLANTFMGDRPVRNDEDVANLGWDIANVLPFVGDATSSYKNAISGIDKSYIKDLMYSLPKGKLPTYKNAVRWQPATVPESLLQAGNTLTDEQKALTGSWYSYEHPTPVTQDDFNYALGFYHDSRPGPGTYAINRLSDRQIANLESIMPSSAKGMSGKGSSKAISDWHMPGELIIPENLRTPANEKYITFTKNVGDYLPEYIGLGQDASKPYKRLQLGNYINAILSSDYQPIMNIPRKYFPYKQGGSANELTSEKAAEMLQDGTAHGKPLTPAQKRYFGYIANKNKRNG